MFTTDPRYKIPVSFGIDLARHLAHMLDVKPAAFNLYVMVVKLDPHNESFRILAADTEGECDLNEHSFAGVAADVLQTFAQTGKLPQDPSDSPAPYGHYVENGIAAVVIGFNQPHHCEVIATALVKEVLAANIPG